MEAAVAKQQSRRRPRRSDAIDNEAKVRSAAEAVFARSGNAMTMDDVAAEAGVSKGTVYSTFRTRERLLDEMTVLFLDRAYESYVEALSRPSAWDALVDVILTPTIGLATTARDAMNPHRPEDSVKRANRRASQALGELIEKGKREGSIDPHISIQHVDALFRGLCLALQPYSPTFREQARECGLVILKGMRA